MKLRIVADTISTYLTLFSALILPVLLLVWVRSYLVSDRYVHVEDGLAVLTGVTNGEVSFWAGRTAPTISLSEHRSRNSSWGWTTRRTFQRVAGTKHFWWLGFGYAKIDQLPWRNVPLTSRAMGVCIPLWFLALLVGAMPMRLLARNMQSSADFLAQRAAEAENAASTSPAVV